MKAITKFVAGAVALGAFAAAAPAAAQYYPGYGYPGYGSGYGVGIVGSIINSVARPYGSYGGYGGYNYNVPGGSQVAANQCTAAVQQRLGGYNGYGYNSGYGRVLGITSVEIRSNGGYRVRGNATAGAGYAYGGTVGFTCRTDPRGLVTDVGFRNGGYGNGYYGQGNYGSAYVDPTDPVAAYGYRRY